MVNKGRVSDALVNTTDLFSTIVENFGYTNWQTQIPTSKPVDSKSLQPIIKNVSDSIRPWVFSEIFKLTTDSSDGKGMSNRNYKLIKFDYGAEEFYNLSTDPLESTNLLNGNLTTTDLTNYNYLCNEMTTLVGGTSFCQSSVGMQEVATQKDWILFPNPAHKTIFIQSVNPLVPHYTFELLDIFARVVYHLDNCQPLHTYSINIAPFPKGQYYVRIKSETKFFTQKLMIE